MQISLSSPLCANREMKNIYSLKDDVRAVKLIQEATQNTERYGVVSEYGLFGSVEWWNAVAENKIESEVIEGKISKVYMSGHNDFPEFKVLSNGDETSWERKGNEKLYQEGAKVRLEYVQVKNRFDHTYNPMLINVWVS